MFHKKNLILLCISILLSTIITGCGGSSNESNVTAPTATPSTPTPPTSPATPDSVTYKIVFTTTWTSDSFATNFPAGRHFSPLIGMTHNEQTELWQSGGLSTSGFEIMAETGGTSTLQQELETTKQQGSIDNVIVGSGIPTSSTSTEITVTVTKDFPLLSLVSMIAPSPDWFVGAKNIKLLENDQWKQSITIELPSYDAGTDSGLRFNSNNIDTDPKDAIVRLTTDASDTDFVDGFHRDTQIAIANFTITLMQ